MIIKRMSILNGTCNFCRRGNVRDSGNGLKYPYEEVTEISSEVSGRMSARFCDDCLKELKDAI